MTLSSFFHNLHLFLLYLLLAYAHIKFIAVLDHIEEGVLTLMLGAAVLAGGGVFATLALVVLFVIFLIHFSQSHPQIHYKLIVFSLFS